MKQLNIVYIFFVSSNSLVMAYLGAITSLEHLPQWMKWVNLAVGIYGSWSNAMIALVITLAKREAAGKPLVPINGGTEQFTKQETETNK